MNVDLTQVEMERIRDRTGPYSGMPFDEINQKIHEKMNHHLQNFQEAGMDPTEAARKWKAPL